MEYTIRPVREEELAAYHKMQVTYLDVEEYSEFLRKVGKYEGLYLCAVDQGGILGIVYPSLFKGELTLQGICVDLNRNLNGRGIGSKLLRAFEEKIRQTGARKTSLGSAEDLRTENFYLKNNWQPVELLFLKIKELPPDYKEIAQREGLSVEIKPDGSTEFRMPVASYAHGTGNRARLKNPLNAGEVIFIFEKKL
jgi:GNAT superfamily N-acetyltransferase